MYVFLVDFVALFAWGFLSPVRIPVRRAIARRHGGYEYKDDYGLDGMMITRLKHSLNGQGAESL
jgi:hypothetical protein